MHSCGGGFYRAYSRRSLLRAVFEGAFTVGSLTGCVFSAVFGRGFSRALLRGRLFPCIFCRGFYRALLVRTFFALFRSGFSMSFSQELLHALFCGSFSRVLFEGGFFHALFCRSFSRALFPGVFSRGLFGRRYFVRTFEWFFPWDLSREFSYALLRCYFPVRSFAGLFA